MSPVVSVIIKNVLLITLIIINLVFVFTSNIGYEEIKYLFIILGSLYILSACLEAFVLAQINDSSKRFTYFTNGFVTKRFLKIILFICCGFILLYSNSIIRYMSVMCFTIAITEILVTIWRYIKNLCFIAFQNDRVIISTNKQVSLSASNIKKIEFRHGLTYIINNQDKALTLRSDIMKEKDSFKNELMLWVDQNNLRSKVVEH